MTSSDSKTDNRFFLLVVPVALLLIAAAVLKTYQLAVSPADANYLLGSRTLTVFSIELELLSGFWLLSGFAHLRARQACLCLFVLFSVVSIVNISNGETSCGCLGVIQVSPLVMLVVDMIAMGLLLLTFQMSPDTSSVSQTFGSSSRAVFIVCGILMLSVLVPVLNLKTTAISDAGEILGDEGIVVLDPEAWIGKPFPLVNFMDQGETLQTGEWRVVLYHEDCPMCQQLIQNAVANPQGPDTAFVEVPPYQSPRRASRTGLLWLKLNNSRDWFTEAPATLILDDGIVTEFIPRSEH